MATSEQNPNGLGDHADDDARAGRARQTLALLNAQADAVRTDLANLRRQLAKSREELNGLRSAQMREADEQLVLAAVHADTVAQTAITSLGELARYSQHDELTGAPGRALLLDRLEGAIALAQRRSARVGVLFVDLDGFKQINDRFGHAAGDEILQLVTHRLQAAVRESDTVSRHSGDEFVVLLPEISAAADAAHVAEKILLSLATPASIAGHEIGLSASVGISIYPDDGSTATRLIANADASMYSSKKSRAGAYAFHAGDTSPGDPDPSPEVVADRPPRQDSVLARHEARLSQLSSANHELLQAAQVAQQLKLHAEEAHRRQIAFVAKAAHAMRTPLSTISTTTALLARTGSNELEVARRRETINRQVKHLARLIDDLLEGSLVGGGEFKLECSALDVNGTVAAVVDACRHEVASRQQRLHFRPAATAATVHGDPMRLAQVVSNLLKNASRRAPEGGTVSLAVAAGSGDVSITVSDDGATIPAEALSTIFDLFVVDDHVAVGDPGLGIGLAVVKELVTAHGGNVRVAARAEQPGCDFIVTLPRTGERRGGETRPSSDG